MADLKNFERVDGWSHGDPQLFIKPEVVDVIGMPRTDFDALGSLLGKDIGVPAPHRTSIYLEKRPTWELGRCYFPLGRISIDPIQAERSYPTQGGTMAVIAHEARHLADYRTRPLRSIKEIGKANAYGHLGGLALWFQPDTEQERRQQYPTFRHALTEAALRYYDTDPLEIRAREEQDKPSTRQHQFDLLFPRSSRTDYLHRTGQLTLGMTLDLGLSVAAHPLAFDRVPLTPEAPAPRRHWWQRTREASK